MRWWWVGNVLRYHPSTYDLLLRAWIFSGEKSAFYRLQELYKARFYSDYRYFNWWWADRKAEEKRSFANEACGSHCTLQDCGNRYIDHDTAETCDDGNRRDGDGCSSTCKLEAPFSFNGPIPWPGGTQGITCGDDVVSAGEQCDRGARCIRRDGKQTNRYCRLEPNVSICNPFIHGNCSADHPDTFCDEDGGDDIFGNWDDQVRCEVRDNGICDKNCQLRGFFNSRGDEIYAFPFAEGQCGNEKVEPYEECDGGEDCTANCQLKKAHTAPKPDSEGNIPPHCGDNKLRVGEECDDGNFIDFDGCTHCLVDLCGNGIDDAGEQCDDNNRLSGDGCSKWCIRENICGNGLLDPGELCDDGNDWSEDGCSSDCQWEYCGDGITQPGIGEECDDPANPNLCRADCMRPMCGDDVVDDVVINGIPYAEVCDPGKHCRGDPLTECGGPIDCPLGPCDKNTGFCMGVIGKKCTEDHHCGYDDCIVQDEIEQGEVVCTATCTIPLCGEACAPDNLDLCGDGRLDPDEECDDGNRADNDGCSSMCQYEDYYCPYECLVPFECSPGSIGAGDTCDPGIADVCPGGMCVPRAECATRCVFGSCGGPLCNSNADCGIAGSVCIRGFCVDPGEECDDGRHCLHDPSKSCTLHEDCTAGSCVNADPAMGISGHCADDTERACMVPEDCQSLCIPIGGDGCTSECTREYDPRRPPNEPRTELLLCQEENNRRIGTDQLDEWQETLLDPEQNPFLGGKNRGWWSWYWNWQRPLLSSRFAWGVWDWDDDTFLSEDCARHKGVCTARFPNATGLLIQAVAASLGWAAQHQPMPDRAPLLPFEATGLGSYPACQEPDAALVSAVEIPSVPPVSLPEYDPALLMRSVQRYLCEEQGFPRRSFPFFCSPEQRLPPYFQSFHFGSLGVQEAASTHLREMILANTLALGYRAGDSALTGYLSEAVQVLSQSLETAVRLFTDLSLVRFADKECPLGSNPTTWCQP